MKKIILSLILTLFLFNSRSNAMESIAKSIDTELLKKTVLTAPDRSINVVGSAFIAWCLSNAIQCVGKRIYNEIDLKYLNKRDSDDIAKDNVYLDQKIRTIFNIRINSKLLLSICGLAWANLDKMTSNKKATFCIKTLKLYAFYAPLLFGLYENGISDQLAKYMSVMLVANYGLLKYKII